MHINSVPDKHPPQLNFDRFLKIFHVTAHLHSESKSQWLKFVKIVTAHFI